MRGTSGRSDDGRVTQRVMREASTGRSSRLGGVTGKLFTALAAASDSISFEAEEFAFLLSMSGIRMQQRFLDIVLLYVGFLANKHDEGLWVNGEDKALNAQGKRILNAMS